MMKHTLLYIAVSGMTLLTSCQLGKHYTRPDLHLTPTIRYATTTGYIIYCRYAVVGNLYGHNLAKLDRKNVG